MSETEDEKEAIVLEDGDAAIVFRADGTSEAILPVEEEDGEEFCSKDEPGYVVSLLYWTYLQDHIMDRLGNRFEKELEKEDDEGKVYN